MNPRVQAISGSLIREMHARKRPSSVDLGLGEPSLLPNPEHFERAMRYVRERGVKYTPNAGDPELRHAVAQHYRYPKMNRAESVCVTVGSQEAMYVTLKALLDPAHDELLVVEPAFPSYAKMATLEGIGVRSVAMREQDDFAFDGERIAAALSEHTRAVVLCSPCNPTARAVTNEAAEALTRALARHAGEPVWLIHDEIYREQTFVDDAAYLARGYPHTIVTNSLSKSNALTGLRLGWILGPADFVAQAVKVHAWVTSCADTFAQRVALEIFQTGALQEHAAWYRDRRAELLAALDASGLRYVTPDGSFYVCVKLPNGMASLATARELVERYDVVTVPGIAFGPSMEGWLRLSWVAPAENVRAGIERIAEYFASLSIANPVSR
ncbi:MAG: pyridoxal phosphate-dependent aminotransferase [Candidatus Eremiobacteraeota bacterium]|nr:pyridoxal phosphate-dependent aminotransferase [Candidatus Eremiobacteraeota bacterium]